MPIHEFQCNKCGHSFEELVFGDDTVTCPKCGSSDTETLMSTCAHTGCGCGEGGGHSEGGHGGGCGCAGCSGGHCASCGH